VGQEVCGFTSHWILNQLFMNFQAFKLCANVKSYAYPYCQDSLLWFTVGWPFSITQKTSFMLFSMYKNIYTALFLSSPSGLLESILPFVLSISYFWV
jgi:hypothetical protein